jgi:hypothetical protein
LTLLKALITSVIAYACPAWIFSTEIQLLKSQCLQNKVLRSIDHFSKRTLFRDFHMAFKIPYVYNCITKLWRQKPEDIQNHENEPTRDIAQGESKQR